MKANELSLGWAMTQPDPAAAVRQVRQNWRRYEQQAAQLAHQATSAFREWAKQPCETLNAVCATERGESFTRLDAVKAHVYLAVMALMMCVAGWLEGGAL